MCVCVYILFMISGIHWESQNVPPAEDKGGAAVSSRVGIWRNSWALSNFLLPQALPTLSKHRRAFLRLNAWP